jgi:hypothetical protein
MTARTNGSSVAARVERLEQQIALLSWLHAEKAHQVMLMQNALAGLLTQQLQPRIQEAIRRQLGGQLGAGSGGPGWVVQSPDTPAMDEMPSA